MIVLVVFRFVLQFMVMILTWAIKKSFCWLSRGNTALLLWVWIFLALNSFSHGTDCFDYICYFRNTTVGFLISSFQTPFPGGFLCFISRDSASESRVRSRNLDFEYHPIWLFCVVPSSVNRIYITFAYLDYFFRINF